MAQWLKARLKIGRLRVRTLPVAELEKKTLSLLSSTHNEGHEDNLDHMNHLGQLGRGGTRVKHALGEIKVNMEAEGEKGDSDNIVIEDLKKLLTCSKLLAAQFSSLQSGGFTII